MPSLSMLVCIPHSPIITIRPKAPPEEPEIEAHLERCRLAVERFAPEQMVLFGPDHYAGFHLSLMPPFCIGLAAAALDDVGGNPGPLAVPADAALDLLKAVRAEGFDAAYSRRMEVDHGFSQPLKRLFGANDRYPTIPVFIDAMSPPFARFGRTRRFGEAVGRFVARSGKRTVFIGSGGMSHHPARYYPPFGTSTPDVTGWQLAGAAGGTMTSDEWFTRLRVLHEEGAVALATGKRTAADIRLNEPFDRDFLERTARGDLAGLDALEPEQMIERSGIGSLELHNWTAAAAAHFAAGGSPAQTAYYAPMIPYGVGYGMIY